MRALSLSLLIVAGCFSDVEVSNEVPANEENESSGGETTAASTQADPAGGDSEDWEDDTGSSTAAGLSATDTIGAGTDSEATDGEATDGETNDAATATDDSAPDDQCNGTPCPVGCFPETLNGVDYAYCGIGNTNHVDWNSARAVCTDLGGDLVRIETAEENSALKQANPEHFQAPVSAWIGATDIGQEGDWTWLGGVPFYVGQADGAPTPPQTHVDWHPLEPNNSGLLGAQEDCGAFWGDGWADLACTSASPYICEF